MKRSYIIILLLSLCSFTWAQSSNFEKLSEMKGVASVTISKAMFRMMPKNNLMDDISSKLEGLMVLSCADDDAIANFKKELAFLNEKNGYEMLVNVKEEGEKVTIFMKKLKQGIMEYVLRIESEEGIELIVVTGKLTIDEARNFATQINN